MSWQPAETPGAADAPSCRAVDVVIVPRTRDLGGFSVGRILPSARRRMVGPFVFFDRMGPAVFPPGQGIDVRPHPHIGLATVTYLLDGTMLHRDSLGSVKLIEPGSVNWMTAGRGIVHSERSDPEIRKRSESMSGFQIWVALPAQQEETDPSFVHYPANALPMADGDGVSLRLVAGSMFGKSSPVRTLSEMFCADATLAAGAVLQIPAEHAERALYLVDGEVEIDGTLFEPGRLLVLAPGSKIDVRAATDSRMLAFGGEPMDGPRHIWWNFVSSRKERIEQAKADWLNGRFGAVPGETEFIPLPQGP